MKIGIIGATGKAGTLILKEAKQRGHDVTAIIRNKGKLTDQDVNVIEKNIFDLTKQDLSDFNVVVNAFNAPQGEEHLHVDSHHTLIEALKGTNTKLIVVGGAGSLFVDEEKTTRLFNTPDFPDFVYPTASNMGKALDILSSTTDITWTHLSPAINFDPEGKRTGSYQLGKDHVITNRAGDSYISYADYAIAIVDEIENPKHENERFTVVGEKA
ncbi:NAD(P)-dependent oxidoreductase [Amphibacillus jilinensis]|uniref:NAD(P)-dependent oxidoreductase n=1 Tax=Amphibacillus jilinensis TaxID=1216008 RepID=UPI0002E744A2|nr:NAD(P)-dependent oxidoreductase [Amphibacillus jilinensis]